MMAWMVSKRLYPLAFALEAWNIELYPYSMPLLIFWFA